MFNAETLLEKWEPVLEASDAPQFADNHRKAVTAVLLENQEIAFVDVMPKDPMGLLGGKIDMHLNVGDITTAKLK